MRVVSLTLGRHKRQSMSSLSMTFIQEHQPKLMTPREAADRLRVARGTVYAAISKGELQSYKVGRSRRISEEQLRQYLDTKKVILNPEFPGPRF